MKFSIVAVAFHLLAVTESTSLRGGVRQLSSASVESIDESIASVVSVSASASVPSFSGSSDEEPDSVSSESSSRE